MWWLIFIVSLASIPLSAEMARERERSSRIWFWIAFFVGPLAPAPTVGAEPLIGRSDSGDVRAAEIGVAHPWVVLE